MFSACFQTGSISERDPSPYLMTQMRKGFQCWSPQLLTHMMKTWMMMSSWRKWVFLNYHDEAFLQVSDLMASATQYWVFGPCCGTAESTAGATFGALFFALVLFLRIAPLHPAWCSLSFGSHMFWSVFWTWLLCTIALSDYPCTSPHYCNYYNLIIVS